MWMGNRSLRESSASLRGFGAAISHSRWFLLIWILSCSAVALTYCRLVEPGFVAKIDIAIGLRHVVNDRREENRHFLQLAFDSEQADTELNVLRSERLLRSVFDALHLAQTPELGDLPSRAFERFSDRVRCSRLGLSFVFEVSYRSRDAALAARVANAIAAAYLADRLDRTRARLERLGAAYGTAQADLAAETQQSRLALRDGTGLDQDLVFAGARVLGTAVPPLTSSYPKAASIFIFAAALGAISGVALILAFARLPRRPQFRPTG
jgi:uncharacterized protein involved in exopolysaccharide biosynthesis